MTQFLSFALFSTVLVISVAVIIATVKAELPHILRALGIDASPLPPLQSNREPRVRVTRPSKAPSRSALRAVA